MDEAPRSLHREALPPRSRNGFYGPLAAMATMMMLGLASVAVVVAPAAQHGRCRGRVLEHHPAGPLPVHALEAPVVAPMPMPNQAPVVTPADLCGAKVYRAGADGVQELTFEVCADAPIPRVIHAD